MRVGEISTERLILRHSDQDRDDWKLLMMLEEEGDFRIFTGVEYSEKYRDDFLDYFEVTDVYKRQASSSVCYLR